MRAEEALRYVIQWSKPGDTLLDIGSGNGEHAARFRDEGINVTTLDPFHKADIQQPFERAWMDMERYDIVWASHVLEHSRNPGLFLEKCNWCLREGGLLAVTVPPLKHQIVGGHVTLWNTGLLLYNLVLAGFDCSRAWYLKYGYNLSVCVVKKSVPEEVYARLVNDSGDVVKLAEFFPTGLTVFEGFHGDF